MWSWTLKREMEEVKDGSGFVRSLFVVRRAEDSCLRVTCDVELNSDGRRNGRLLARGRRGTMVFMLLLELGGAGSLVHGKKDRSSRVVTTVLCRLFGQDGVKISPAPLPTLYLGTVCQNTPAISVTLLHRP